MSDFNLSFKSQIKDRQLRFLSKSSLSHLTANAEDKDIEGIVRETFEGYLVDGGFPLFQKRRAERHQVPFREDIQDNMKELTEDISILSDEQQHASEFLRDAFNSVHSEKKRLTNRINRLNNLVSDLLLLTGEEGSNTIYFKESFQRVESMDHTQMLDEVSKAAIHTGEGVLTLGRLDAINLSVNARIGQVAGNGRAGVHQIARKFVTTNNQGEEVEAYHFINENEQERHTELENILDDRPDTLFEYQMVNVPEDFKREHRFYDFGWAHGREEGDNLRLKLIVELDSEQTLNWITLDPYYPQNNSGKILIRSIKTSTNGFDYEPLYSGKVELNQTVNATPQTYRLDDIFDGDTKPENAQYTGSGVWSFPARQARFVEFVIDQPQSQHEVIGQAVYTLTDRNTTYPVQVPEPEELKDSPPGEYVRRYDGNRVIFNKQIHATRAGWRYAIGLRDIKLMQQLYEEKSHFVSQRYELPRNAERLVLYAKEILPESYLNIVNLNNDWIQYEASFNDTDWMRVSPMHHEPLSDDFPPKIVEVNTSAVDLTNAFQVHKQLIQEDNPTHLRLRITLQRPEGDEFLHTTPMVEEVALRVDMEGGV